MNDDFKMGQEQIERLKKKIIMQENLNLKNREKTDAQMVKWIKDLIEEEVKCCLNQ